MSTKDIMKRWKEQRQRIKKEHHGNGDIYSLLLDLRNSNSKSFKETLKMHHKMKLANNIWNCDLICQYIQYLEEELNNTINKLKLAQQGFDERNKCYGINKHIG
jgi:hypothetical protein